jgi:septation ring formation regulator EzrA
MRTLNFPQESPKLLLQWANRYALFHRDMHDDFILKEQATALFNPTQEYNSSFRELGLDIRPPMVYITA